jgi:hypothetical protein
MGPAGVAGPTVITAAKLAALGIVAVLCQQWGVWWSQDKATTLSHPLDFILGAMAVELTLLGGQKPIIFSHCITAIELLWLGVMARWPHGLLQWRDKPTG